MTITIRCPQCNRFMGEVMDYGRLVCSECGTEITIRSKDYRRIERAVIGAPETTSLFDRRSS